MPLGRTWGRTWDIRPIHIIRNNIDLGQRLISHISIDCLRPIEVEDASACVEFFDDCDNNDRSEQFRMTE